MVGGTAAYRPLDWFVIRAPLLALDERPTGPPSAALPADPRVRRALAVGAADLLRALETRPVQGHARLARKLARYLIRMSSRPTPYGLFAGVALGRWDDHSDVELAASAPVLRSRPDMGRLFDLVAAVEQLPQVRPHLRWYAHPAAHLHAGRVFLVTPERPVSVRATAAVRAVLERARVPATHAALVAAVMDVPGATREKAVGLLDGLIEQGLLRSDLQPTLTAAVPARDVAQRLAAVPATAGVADAADIADIADTAAALTELLDLLAEWDGLGPAAGAAAYPKLATRAQELPGLPRPPAADGTAAASPLQTDMALPLAGQRLHAGVAAEVARGAELLLRLAPRPRPALEAYRTAFLERYGRHREVPLLELLDVETGLGPPGPPPAANDDEAALARRRMLLGLVAVAVRDDRREVELDDATLATIGRPLPEAGRLPRSLELSVFVAARSRAALDAGAYDVVIGPNVGAPAAGRALGRFAGLLGAEADAALRAAAAAEDAVDPGRRSAEVTYVPHVARAANVAVRPLVRPDVIGLDSPGTIPLDDLFVTIADGPANRFVLRRGDGREVVATAAHMLNPERAPALARFLEDVAFDTTVALHGFDWGPAGLSPFLPRVRSGRVVLAPAMWRLSGADAADLDRWRARWRPPRHVYLTRRDNRLLLDLDDPAHLDELRAEAARATVALTVQEALPGPEHAWLHGPGGRYLSELVVPLVRVARTPARPAPRRMPPVPAATRVRAPGSDWLHVTFHVGPTTADDLLSGPIATFAADVADAELIDRWFFVRYADPRPHLRLRWHGDPARLSGALAPRLLRWGAELVADGRVERFGIDTYEREVERYGGPEGMTLVEELFAADSAAVVALLGLPLDRTLLGAVAIDDLLAALGHDAAAREALYRDRVADRRAAAGEYRQRQRELRAVLAAGPAWGGPVVTAALARRRARVAAVAAGLAALEADGRLGRPPIALAADLVHMHANRLLGLGHPPEQQALGLLLRTRESLRRAPA